MNINNVVLVRAMNNLPLNGELIPSCEGKRLVNDNKSDFYYYMRECVKNHLQQKLGRDLMIFFESPDYNLIENMMHDYIILTGDYYTTSLSFSLNGLVPDDINNKFSNMKMAVLEPIKNQMNANFITIETIDTAIKGRIKTSKDAILLIEHEFFSKLSKIDQTNLFENFNIKFFDDNLKDSVDKTLKENGYPSLPLIQKRELHNIEECAEKESMIDFEDKFSLAVGASRLRLQQLTFHWNGGTNLDETAHDKLIEEHTNTLKIQEYYRNKFYEYMLEKAQKLGIEITGEEKYFLFTEYQESIDVMRSLVDKLINSYGGLENFKQFVCDYNEYIYDNYLTNQQIINFMVMKQK